MVGKSLGVVAPLYSNELPVNGARRQIFEITNTTRFFSFPIYAHIYRSKFKSHHHKENRKDPSIYRPEVFFLSQILTIDLRAGRQKHFQGNVLLHLQYIYIYTFAVF